MKKLTAILACSAALLPLAAQEPAATDTRMADRYIYLPIRERERSRQHPGGAAPTIEALTRLFHEKAPEHAGKPVVIEYGWAEEYELQVQIDDDRAKYGPTGRRVGVAKVQEQTLHERHRRAKGRMLGGGALVVLFDPETGIILRARRAK